MQSVSSRIWTRVAVSISYGHLNCRKVNIIERLQFELVYFKAKAYEFSHYTKYIFHE